MDIYREITDRIITQMEQGIIPWTKPWIARGQAISYATGKPYSLLNQMLLGRPGEYGDATVTVCHSRTPDLAEHCRAADFIFLAVGKPKMLTADMVSEKAVIIDVGINRTPEGLCGDADFDALKDKVAAITPVPGGVGPMTIAMLLKNTVQSWQERC